MNSISDTARNDKFIALLQNGNDNAALEVMLREAPELATRLFFNDETYNVGGENIATGGCSAMHVAASRGDVELGKVLLAAMKRHNERQQEEMHTTLDAIRDRHDNTPMHWAALNGHLNFVKFLHENGASLSPANLVNTTPYMDAAINGHTEILQYVETHGDERTPVVHENVYNTDALTRAAVMGMHPETTKHILQTIANNSAKPLALINECDGKLKPDGSGGFTVLDMAEQKQLQLQHMKAPDAQQARMGEIISALKAHGALHTPEWENLSGKDKCAVQSIELYSHWVSAVKRATGEPQR